MIAGGVFAEDENFELLEGLVVRKMTKHPPHWVCTELVRNALQALGLAGFFVHSQNPVTTSDSEPEPDAALVRGALRDYRCANPDPDHTPLVIEVADSSLSKDRTWLSKDRTWKKRIYARAGIAVYWIINLADEQVEVYSQPTGPCDEPDYAHCEIIPASGTLPVVIDGKVVGQLKVKELLP
jgi:Uma2 family endonuclease